MITTVRAFEAKTHLSSLLERVAQGEEIMITRHGKPLARLIPVVTADNSRVDLAISKLKALRKGCTLDGLSWQTLRSARHSAPHGRFLDLPVTKIDSPRGESI
ncbi:MAG: type II toxin-antitoxin system prevent-host-death family antitoxin [Methylococcales bacterium]